MQHRMSRARLAWRATGLYYKRLNEDDAFRDDLAALFSRLEALGAPDPLKGVVWEEAQARSLDELEKLAEDDISLGAPYRLASSIRREVEAFLSRWPLPGRIWKDLRWSYALHLRLGKPRKRPRLELAPFIEVVPTPGLPVVEDVGELAGIRVQTVERLPWIFPSHPLPFLYDPLAHDRRWLEEAIEAICKEIRASILAQAQVYEEEVEAQGWGRLPPRLRQKAEEAMRRLYLRVMKGYTWGQIAAYTGCDKAQARRQVRYYARLIGLPLPNLEDT